MATMKRLFVFASCVLSGIAMIFGIVSLATEQWVVTDSAMWINFPDSNPNAIKYGLFEGTFTTIVPQPHTLQITMTCLVGKNVCAFLCAGNSDDRNDLLTNLYNGTYAKQDDGNCPSVQRVNIYRNRPILRTESNIQKKFINCGVWVSTIFFLVVSIAFGLLSSGLSLYNTVYNPIEVYLSILGIFVYNGIALGSCIFAMVLWGVQHITSTFHNVAIYYTLVGLMNSDKRASLGYSYWINIVSIAFYTASIAVLYIRQYLLSKDPIQKIVEREESADPVIYLY